LALGLKTYDSCGLGIHVGLVFMWIWYLCGFGIHVGLVFIGCVVAPAWWWVRTPRCWTPQVWTSPRTSACPPARTVRHSLQHAGGEVGLDSYQARGGTSKQRRIVWID